MFPSLRRPNVKNKVVINKCFGGFHLSDAACARLIELGARYVRAARPDETTESIFGHKFMVEDHSIPRHDPLLIQVVEELGEAASGDFSELIVFEIEGNRYRIGEHDGAESVYTPRDSYWITIPE
jgi:hypothetical protein